MKLNYLKDKTYVVPKNTPKTQELKYLKIIYDDYGKYLELIHLCGNLIMFDQFYRLLQYSDKNRLAFSSYKKRGTKIINDLLKDNFIGTDYLNSNKFIYLRKPALNLLSGVYNTGTTYNLKKNLKNNKFKSSILCMEHFLALKEVPHYTDMFNQLHDITEQCYLMLLQSGNKYGYSIQHIEKILTFTDTKDVNEYLKNLPEHIARLGIIRILWTDIGYTIFRNLFLHKETVTTSPHLLKIYMKPTGEIIIHYVPNIIIFDINKDLNHYKNKTNNLFHSFSAIRTNSLYGCYNNYINSNKTDLGNKNENHIGYKLTLIGEEGKVNVKKDYIDSLIGININSPLLDSTTIYSYDITKYTNHVSRKHNTISKQIDNMLADEIGKQYKKIKNTDTSTATMSNNDIIDLLK